jgi:hypothetical protein
MNGIEKSKLLKTDVDGLMMQSRGMLINVNDKEYNEYKRKQAALASKDNEIKMLGDRINILEEQMLQILGKLNEHPHHS